MKTASIRNIFLFFTVLTFLLVVGCISQNDQVEDSHVDQTADFELGVHAFEDKIAESSDAILLDVRQPEEYEVEHIEEALLLPLGEISQSALLTLGIEKNDEILLYCRSGSRSAQAYDILTALGYTNVKSLGGGLIHWKEDGLSVVAGVYEGLQVTATGTVVNGVNTGPVAVLSEVEHDFGVITQFGGIVSTTFSLENSGMGDLDVGGISTSCGCTNAEIDIQKIPPGGVATITVYFDPNLHGEPLDRFSRTVFVPTNDPNNPELEYRIWVDILEGE